MRCKFLASHVVPNSFELVILTLSERRGTDLLYTAAQQPHCKADDPTASSHLEAEHLVAHS